MSTVDQEDGGLEHVASERVTLYVDGFNLYMSMRDAGLTHRLWLSLASLARGMLRPNQKLQAVHYFTALVNRRARRNLQEDFLSANSASSEFNVYKGEFDYRTIRCSSCGTKLGCRSCGSDSARPVEKQSDVNLGTQLGLDAATDEFDVAIIISSDSDFIGAIELVRARCPGKQIIVALPPGRYQIGKPLGEAATGYFEIWPDSLAAAQLPKPVVLEDGRKLWRPSAWS